jgi:hypothetical protein
MKKIALLIGFIGLAWGMTEAPVYADASLRVQPLQYQESLRKGERKKGFIDVSNPTSQAVKVKFAVEGFRQIDNDGNLAFYPDEQLRKGIQLDYDAFEIPAKKSLRLYFIADGTKLPTGDVFAAIFAQTIAEAGGASPSVRIGSLLLLTNQTPSEHKAEVGALTAPILQIGSTLNGRVAIKNSARANTSSGFFPTVTISLWPFGSTTSIKGPLVFANNTRQVSFNLPSNQLGIYKLSASVGSSRQERWVIVITGMWRWVGVAIVGLALAILALRFAIRQHRRELRK